MNENVIAGQNTSNSQNNCSLPLVTVMIATFNSEKVLKRTMDAIAEQTYPNIEILLMDGGSTDQTFQIAKAYDNCKIINNPKTDPVSAKLLGLQNAHGRYLITVDHDEVMINPKTIELEVQSLTEHPQCKAAIVSGYRRPKDYPLLNQYISEYGDPFSLFIYRFSKDDQYLEKLLNKYYTRKFNNEEYSVFSFEKIKKQPLFELVCAGSMIDRNYFVDCTDIETNPATLTQLFYIMLSMGNYDLAYIKNAPLEHYSVDSLKAYLPKIKWRIINNVHYADKASNGFTGRAKLQEKSADNISFRKYLFVLYTITIIPSVIDAVCMAVTRKNPVYLLHPFLCWYVLVEIAYQMILKLQQKTPVLTSYDGKKKISSD